MMDKKITNLHFWREKRALVSFSRLFYRLRVFIVRLFDLSIANTVFNYQNDKETGQITKAGNFTLLFFLNRHAR